MDPNQIENEVYISSLKGSLGHLLGAAGAVETIFTVLSCKEKTMGPSINIETLDSNLKLDEMPFLKILQKTKTLNTNKFVALKNSFGFGGTNVSICIGTYTRNK
jgi:3-oxoacyl-[acyl-carrier-protein] synthase II